MVAPLQLWNPAQLVDTVVGDYHLLRFCGAGGAGYVYEAQAPSGESVALKLYKSWLFEKDAAATEARIAREAALRTVTHPHLCRIIEHGIAVVPNTSGRYLVMELIDGEGLDAHIKQHGAFSWTQFHVLATALLDAARCLHEKGFVHRDIKPENVLVEAASGRFVLADFGVVSSLEDDTVTQSDAFLGTTRYAPPEWLTRDPPEAADSPALDVYSLGATFFEAITGSPPFAEHQNRFRISQAILNRPALLPFVAGYPPEVLELVRSMLAKSPTSRPSLQDCFDAVQTAAAPAPGAQGGTTVDALAKLRTALDASGLAASDVQRRRDEALRNRWNEIWLGLSPKWDPVFRRCADVPGVVSAITRSAPVHAPRITALTERFPDHVWTFGLQSVVQLTGGAHAELLYLFAGDDSRTGLLRCVSDGQGAVDLGTAQFWCGSIEQVGAAAEADVPVAASLLESKLLEVFQRQLATTPSA